MTTRNENWQHRQEVMRSLLANDTVRSQGELVAQLRARGFSVTQSSVSRDLAELRAFKVDGRYVTPETMGVSLSLEVRDVFDDVRAVAGAGPNLLVLRTPAGRAPSVALALDGAKWPEVVGTLAGDDTVFVATADRNGQARLRARLNGVKPCPSP